MAQARDGEIPGINSSFPTQTVIRGRENGQPPVEGLLFRASVVSLAKIDSSPRLWQLEACFSACGFTPQRIG